MIPSDLAAAGTSYPEYITDSYLRLPEYGHSGDQRPGQPDRRGYGATNPYDQAIAIQNYLRSNFTYQLDAGPAPDGRDIVDYFLFDSQVGRCDHYASSMAVMLRTLGVPTRIVTGLAPVPFDSEMSGYVYRGRNAHAWVEVYFPGYGWIPFEPTPTQQTIDLDQTGVGSWRPHRNRPRHPLQPAFRAAQKFRQPPTPTPTPLGGSCRHRHE